MYKYIYCLSVGILLLLPEANAQFMLSGEFRPRTEFSRGYKTLATDQQAMSVFTAQRTRLNAAYKTEGVFTKLVLQDVRLWGSQPQLVANEDYASSLHEAWAELFLLPGFSLRAGRQELVYDDHRILGNVAWAHQARSHDLVLFKYEEKVKLHAGIAHHENSNVTNNIYNGPDAYKNLQFAWFNKNWDNAGLSLLLLNNGVPVLLSGEKEETRYSQTFGGRFIYKMEEVSFAANLYGQSGKHNTGKEINAWNGLAEVSWRNQITAGYEYLSGNSYDKTDKVYAFEPLYGTNHKFNGFMDYFYVGNHINSVGLQDVYLKYSNSIKKAGISADLHYFTSAGEISAGAKKYLGTELDLGISWSVRPMATISAGWSFMAAGESMELLREGDHSIIQNWGYIMLSVTPVFIQ